MAGGERGQRGYSAVRTPSPLRAHLLAVEPPAHQRCGGSQRTVKGSRSAAVPPDSNRQRASNPWVQSSYGAPQSSATCSRCGSRSRPTADRVAWVTVHVAPERSSSCTCSGHRGAGCRGHRGVLRADVEAVGGKAEGRDADTRQLLRGLVEAGYQAPDIREMAAWIEDAKNRGLLPSDDLSGMRRSPFRMEEIYTRYQGRLCTVGAVDFGDLIVGAVGLLRDYEEVRRRVHDRFRVVLVDEFQDANRAQFELLRRLHGPNTYVCVVGDDDQSIYRFRGADVDSFLAFPERFTGTQVIRLEQNYRSTGAILDLASAVVANNRRRMGKTLWTDQEQGALPTVAYLDDQDAEAAYCAELLKEGNAGGTAILYRMNFQSRAFETLFQSRRIPYRIIGTVRFYDRDLTPREVEDLYLETIDGELFDRGSKNFCVNTGMGRSHFRGLGVVH